jgi:hypothetical protein
VELNKDFKELNMDVLNVKSNLKTLDNIIDLKIDSLENKLNSKINSLENHLQTDLHTKIESLEKKHRKGNKLKNRHRKISGLSAVKLLSSV